MLIKRIVLRGLKSDMSDSGCLYIVATPIGNLNDISVRARDVLQECDIIAAEDTRHSGKLLEAYSISTRMMSVHDHNESDRVQYVLEQIKSGLRIALISDAGTPLVSDPGYRLVRAALDADVRVVPIPGACAAIAALSVAGLPTDRFVFEGFLAVKGGSRQQALAKMAVESGTTVFYEAPHRLLALLEDIKVSVPGRQVTMARELTKTFETVKSLPIELLCEFVAADSNQQRGELVVMVEGVPKQHSLQTVGRDELISVLRAELPLTKAAKLAAKLLGEKRQELYQQMQDLDEPE